MDPQLSGFALGLLVGAAKIGLLGTIGFGIAWWRAYRKLRRYEEVFADPDRLEERLASVEQSSDYTSAKLTELLETQAALIRQLSRPAADLQLKAPPTGRQPQ